MTTAMIAAPMTKIADAIGFDLGADVLESGVFAGAGGGAIVVLIRFSPKSAKALQTFPRIRSWDLNLCHDYERVALSNKYM
jgi:hypothetical protein